MTRVEILPSINSLASHWRNACCSARRYIETDSVADPACCSVCHLFLKKRPECVAGYSYVVPAVRIDLLVEVFLQPYVGVGAARAAFRIG
jgi:hypothetical protein